MEAFNTVCNLPEILPWVREPPYEPRDIRQDLRRCILHVTKDGGLAAEHMAGDLYEVHIAFRPGFRGAKALQIVRDGCDKVMERAAVIFSAIPAHNVGARIIARQAGAQFIGRCARDWMTSNGPVPRLYYAIDRLTWRHS